MGVVQDTLPNPIKLVGLILFSLLKCKRGPSLFYIDLLSPEVNVGATGCASQVVELAIPELELARVAHVVVIGAEMALAHRPELAVPALRKQCALKSASHDFLHAAELGSRGAC